MQKFDDLEYLAPSMEILTYILLSLNKNGSFVCCDETVNLAWLVVTMQMLFIPLQSPFP